MAAAVQSLYEIGQNAPEEHISLAYLADVPKYDLEKPYAIEFDIPLKNEDLRSNLEFESSIVSIRDLRLRKKDIRLEEHGFEVLDISSDFEHDYFSSEAQIGEMEGVERILKERFSTEHVFCFTHRHRKAERVDGENVFKVPQHKNYSFPVNNPHADFTIESGLSRLGRHLTPEEYKTFNDGNWRIRIMNFWKPIHHTVQNHPLVFCDRTTLSGAQIMPCDLISPDYLGGFSFVKYSEGQQWYWLSNQQLSEAFIFTSWDSHPPFQPPFTFHASCVLPGSSPDLPKRESMEVRALVMTKLAG